MHYAESYGKAVATVARERKFLASTLKANDEKQEKSMGCTTMSF
jgi:hypothetical protein